MPQENSYRYILTVLDEFTRYAWTVPLKDKKGETVANAFKEIMKNHIENQINYGLIKAKNFKSTHVQLIQIQR